MSLEATLISLAQQGERLTPVRRALLETLAKKAEPVSVPTLMAELKKRGHKANKTTFYRQLEALETLGVIRAIHLTERAVRYELVRSGDHHHHLVCTSCGKIQDTVFDGNISKYEKTIFKKMKFKVAWHALEFFGLCAACQKKK